MTLRGRIARVILDSPLPQLDHELDYAIPDALVDDINIGTLVSVPLRGGARHVEGWVVDKVDESEYSGALQPITKAVSVVPVLSAQTLELSRRIARRQAGSVSDVLRLAIPSRYVRTEKSFIAEQQDHAHVTDSQQVASRSTSQAASPVQRFRLNLPQQSKIHLFPEIEWIDFSEGSAVHTIPAWALNFAAEAGRLLEQGESSVLVAPDFRDLNHVVHALEMCGLAEWTVRTDSSVSGKERYAQYLHSLSGRAGIVVGNRSAVMFPVERLGLIALWDDGDENYQEPLAPYMHSRDVALLRQEQSSCRLVFASHSRTTEIERLCELNFLDSVTHVERVPLVVQSEQQDDRGNPIRLPADALLNARQASKSKPVLVQVASPGFSPALVCSSCRDLARCVACTGPLRLQTRGGTPQCRWCNALATSWSCRECSASEYEPIGHGTERTAAEIGRAFPGLPIHVADANNVQEFIDESPCVVIATPGAEPVARGGYGAVLLLDGEKQRYRQSLRANEDAIRKWTHASTLVHREGHVFLVGAGDELGAVMSSWDFSSFARAELLQRTQLRLPPVCRVLSISGPESQVRAAVAAVGHIESTRTIGMRSAENGEFVATLTCDYRHNDEVATALRARVIAEATSGPRSRGRGNGDQRVVRLRVRFDESSLNF